MKTNPFIFICFLMFLLKSPLFAQNLNVRYSVEGDFTITDFLEAVKEKTGYKMAYKQSDVQDNRKIKIKYERKPLNTILENVLKKYGLSFVINNGLIIIKKEMKKRKLECIARLWLM